MKLSFLTPELQRAAAQLPRRRWEAVTELRLRRGQPAAAAFPWGEQLLTLDGRELPVTAELLRQLVERATDFSPYALKLEETGLYLPLEDGCRMGLCGEAVLRDGTLWGLRCLSSVVIRLARQRIGIAGEAAAVLTAGNRLRSALIISPPGGGKTTFLRDLIRAVSEKGWRVCAVDERRELAGQRDGQNTLDLGPRTDVLSGCPKALGIPLALRVMNPQALAVDELASQKELDAARYAAFSGVALLATAHGDSLSRLRRRPGFGPLLESGAFDYCIRLTQTHTAELEELESYAETSGRTICDSRGADERLGGAAGPSAQTEAAEAAPAGAGASAGGDGAPYGVAARAV